MSTPKNAINWFEIPALDIQRAKKFYETILKTDLAILDLGELHKMAVLPGDQNSVSGALVYHDWYKPSTTHGPLIYLNANPDLEIVQNRIEKAGGKVILPKRQISPDHGYMAVFEDSEGNRIALHSNS